MSIKKLILLCLSLVFTSNMIVGCQTVKGTGTIHNDSEINSERVNTAAKDKVDANHQPKENSEKLKVDRMILSSGGKDTLVLEEDEVIEAIEPLIANAVREKGIVNMVSPELTIEIVYTNHDTQRYFLWIGEKGEKITLMKPDDTHTIYTASEELNDRLIELIENAD